MEDWAIAYYSLRSEQQTAVSIGFVLLGGLLFAVAKKGVWELERAPYFVYSAMIISLSYFPVVIIWLTYPWMVRNDATWVIVLQTVLIMIVFGYLLALVASARSRNAFGSNWMAILAFIPFANFWLLFARPRSEYSPALLSPPAFMRGEIGVVLAIAVIITSTVSARVVAGLAESDAEQLVNADPEYAGLMTRRLIQTRGLPQTLKQIADNVSLPATIDEVTALSTIVALDNELFRTFTVDMEDLVVDDYLRRDTADFLCKHPSMRELLLAGAQIHEIFAAKDRHRFGQFTVTYDDCSVES